MIKPALILPSILIGLTLWGLLWLGFWQLGRADEKRAIETAIVAAQSNLAELTPINELINKQHYQVLLSGYYDSSKQFIYDNQIVNGNAGYYVLTPFILDNKTAILVNRGFVAWHGRRNKLANIAVDGNQTTIQVGLIKPKTRIELKAQTPNTQFPILIQSLDLKQLSHYSGYQIIPMLAQLNIKAKNGFYRKWEPFYGSVDKHLGYALQWFSMAFVLSIIALVLYRKNSKKTINRVGG